MKITTSLVLAIGILAASCKKETSGLNQIDVKLSATTFFKNGSEETHYERSGTIVRSSFAQSVNEGASNKFLVNLGASGTAPNLSSFGVSFLFNRQTNPEGITGIYNFPQDQLLIRTVLRNEVTRVISETFSLPTRGKVAFLFDRNTMVISGTIENMEFNIVPNDPYNRYRITINGSFKNVSLK